MRDSAWVWVAGGLLLICGCTVPFALQERAAIEPGLSGGIGAGGGAINCIEGRGNRFAPRLVGHPAAVGTGSIYVRYGLSRRFAMFVQADGLVGNWLSEGDSAVRRPELVDVTAGAKFRLGKGGAVRINVGVPSGVTCHYIQDLPRDISMDFGLGFSRGLSFGLGWHPRVASFLRAHLVGIVGVPLTAGIGLGVEFSRACSRNEGGS